MQFSSIEIFLNLFAQMGGSLRQVQSDHKNYGTSSERNRLLPSPSNLRASPTTPGGIFPWRVPFHIDLISELSTGTNSEELCFRTSSTRAFVDNVHSVIRCMATALATTLGGPVVQKEERIPAWQLPWDTFDSTAFQSC